MKTHKVLALVATVAVALSGWCYDPPKHTNAYTRAGVTFAQRGGMEASTYVVTNVTMNGNARMLPPYLYELDLDDTYPEDAAWYYAQADYSDGGGCSVRRIGNAVERNYDWKFDAAPTFVVRVKGSDDRFASVAVCNVGTNLKEEMVRSGTPSRFYKCLAGHATDGVNENGVFAEVNVVDGTWPRTSGTIHGLGAVRYALDHGTNAQQVAEFLAANVYLPEGFGVNFHYMIADETATYIVENGVAHPVTNAPAVMTNFKLYPKTQGAGWERYELLSDTANAITDAWFTRAYAEDTNWISEFDSVAEMETAKEYWRNGLKESHRGQHVGNKWWWQSVHTSVYDITNRVLRISVQETDDWYTFAVPSAGGVKPEAVREIVRPMIGDATNDLSKTLNDSISNKRDKTDLDVYESVLTPWTFISDGNTDGLSIGIDQIRDPKQLYRDGDFCGGLGVPDENYPPLQLTWGPADWDEGVEHGYTLVARRSVSLEPTDGKLAHTSKLTAGGLAKFGADGELDEAEPSGTSADPANADYRDPTDNTCHKTEFGEWVAHDVPSGLTLIGQPRFVGERTWIWDSNPVPVSLATGDEYDLSLAFLANVFGTFTATRSAACTTGELFTTTSYVTNAVNAAKYVPSATDPTFSNAVLAVGIDTNTVAQIGELKQFFDDLPTGTAATSLGGIILALLGAAAYLKKKTALLETDGTASVQFATDLLGKSVAINALHYALYSVPTSGADANKLKDRAVNAFTFSGGSLPTFPAQVAGYARDFLMNVTATADGSNITIPETDGSTATSIGDALAFTAGKTYLVAITEIAAKHYYIRVIDTTPANA